MPKKAVKALSQRHARRKRYLKALEHCEKYLENSEEQKVQYLRQLAEYQQTEAYKLFQKKQKNADLEKVKLKSLTGGKLGETSGNPIRRDAIIPVKVPGLDISVFTEEFLDHNKSREKELRELRKLNMIYEEQNAVLSKHVDELKLVVQRLENETAQQRTHNVTLVQHLENLREMLAQAFVGLPLPDTNEVPTSSTIDNYMTKLHQIILESAEQHGDLIVSIREIVNKLNLPDTYDT